jgi:phosphopantetheinyl transferase
MPLIVEKEINSETKVAIWQNTEENDFFISSLDLNEEEIIQLEKYKSFRKREILSSRHLLRNMTEKEYPFRKDKYGKPYLEGSQKYISLSHSGDLTAAIISNICVGIDIQKRVEKITRIRHKYVSKLEQNMIEASQAIEYLHVLWGAKESLYKAYGKKELDFIKHLQISPFRYVKEGTSILKGNVLKNEYNESYNIYSELIKEYFLVYACHITT